MDVPVLAFDSGPAERLCDDTSDSNFVTPSPSIGLYVILTSMHQLNILQALFRARTRTLDSPLVFSHMGSVDQATPQVPMNHVRSNPPGPSSNEECLDPGS